MCQFKSLTLLIYVIGYKLIGKVLILHRFGKSKVGCIEIVQSHCNVYTKREWCHIVYEVNFIQCANKIKVYAFTSIQWSGHIIPELGLIDRPSRQDEYRSSSCGKTPERWKPLGLELLKQL